MANNEAAGAEDRIKTAQQPASDQFAPKRADEAPSTHKAFASYSLSSPDFRQAIQHMPSSTLFAADNNIPPLLRALENHGAVTTPEIPPLLKALEPPTVTDKPEPPPVPVAPAEAMEDTKKTVDPCTKQILNALPVPENVPKALDSVKDRDPELFKQIQAKVTDPRYTGELGNITVSTHDAKGRVNGCVFEQNVPYWESGPAVQALVDVKNELAKKGITLEADPLNGAGRTLGQEEAIVWRNSGVHAQVGKSNHGYGKAEDFKPDPDPDAKRQPWEDPFVNATLHAHGWRQGDSYGPLKNDLHHWSFVGMGPVQDGHPPPHKSHPKHHKHR
jgi:hypothetical protein